MWLRKILLFIAGIIVLLLIVMKCMEFLSPIHVSKEEVKINIGDTQKNLIKNWVDQQEKVKLMKMGKVFGLTCITLIVLKS